MSDLVFIAMSALEQSHRSECTEDPGQFADFWQIALAPKNAAFRIESAGEKIERYVDRIFAALRGVSQRRHRVIIGDKIKRFAALLQLDRGFDRAEIVADVKGAGGLNAGEDAHDGNSPDQTRRGRTARSRNSPRTSRI